MSLKCKTDDDEKFTKNYTEKTVLNKRGKEVKNKNYDEAFAKIIADLDSKNETYEIGRYTPPEGSKEAGSFTYDGGVFHINYSDKVSKAEGGGAGNVLYHETLYAKQFTKGKLWFQFNITSNSWDSHGDDVYDEAAALKFGATAGEYNDTYVTDEGWTLPTRQATLASLTTAQVVNYITQGANVVAHGYQTGSDGQRHTVQGTAFVGAEYITWPREELKSNVNERTFNGNIIAYPYK